MPCPVASGQLVYPRGEQEVPREHASFSTIRISLVVGEQCFVVGLLIRPPTQVRDPPDILIAPMFVVALKQQCVRSVTLYGYNQVLLEDQLNPGLQVALERQIDVADRKFKGPLNFLFASPP